MTHQRYHLMKNIFAVFFSLVLMNISFPATANNNSFYDLQGKILQQTVNLSPKVLELALSAYNNARSRGLESRSSVLTIIDYSKPSTQPRLWVIDIKQERVLYNLLVAHGRNSGNNYATSFSNQNGSLKSSLGLYLTGAPYYGHMGLALPLLGLEKGFNDHAQRRAIVIHGAPYVSSEFVKRFGRIGRSWGCPAIPSQMTRPVIEKIKHGTFVFAYYPENQWLNQSTFLS